MNATETGSSRTWLRVGEGVYPVYGDDLRGWSTEAGDLHRAETGGFRYASLEEVFFALVNLTVSGGEPRRRAGRRLPH